MREKKTHKLLAILSPFICFIYVVGASFASGLLEEKIIQASVGVIISNTVAVALILLLALAFNAINKKYLLDVKMDMKLSEGEKQILVLLVLLVPLVFIIGQYVSYLVYTNYMGVEYTVIPYPLDELKEDMLAAVHAIIIAPILEEFCFRIIPISLCQRKVGKITMLITTSLLFGYCHGKNFWLTMINGIIFGLIFILTNRPIISIVCHMAHNIFSFIVGLIAFAGFATIYNNNEHPTLVELDVIPAIFISIVFVVSWICFFYSTKKQRYN